MNENITILKLPPHTTHMLQDLDVGVFKAFKTTYDQRLTKWARKNVGEKLQKADFVKMISEIWKQADPVLIQKAFASTGVYDPSIPERTVRKSTESSLTRRNSGLTMPFLKKRKENKQRNQQRSQQPIGLVLESREKVTI